MRLHSAIIPTLLFFVLGQSPQDTIRRHYEAAEAQRLAGNLVAAEAEYGEILGEGYQRLGEIYLAQGDYKRAIPVLESAAGYRPDSTAVLISLAIACFEAQQYEKALGVARKTLTVDPKNAGAHQMLGKSYFMLGDVGNSIGELEKAAKLAPDDIDVAYTLGIAYLRNRQFAEAKQLYNSMVGRFGGRPQLHMVIGRAYRQSGLLAESAEEFRRAIALDPHFPRSHYYLGLTYLLDEGQSKIAEALEEFKIEVAANPDEFFANYYLGVVYNYQRKWEPAITYLQKASTIQPNNPDPYFQLGQAYQESDQHERAVEVLRKSIALNPNLGHNKGQVTAAHHRLARSLLKLGQTEAGQKELQIASDLKAEAFKLEQQAPSEKSGMGAGSLPSAISSSPEPAFGKPTMSESERTDNERTQELKNSAVYYEKIVGTAHNNVGLLRAERRDFRKAAEQFALAVKWSPQQEGLDYNLGLANYKSDSFEQATSPLEGELKNHPENQPAAVLLGMSYFMTGKYARASELLGRVVNSQAGDINIYYALASSLIKQGKVEAAERVIGQMRTIADSSPQIHLLAAEEYAYKGKPDRALLELRDTAVVNSNVPRVHVYAGTVYSTISKPEEAIREFDRELALNPNDLLAKFRLAEASVARNNADRGVQLLREIILERPEHIGARYNLGKVLLQRRDIPGAIENLEAAAKLDPERPDIHFELGQAYISAGRSAEGNSQIEISKKLKTKIGNQASKFDN
jgi:tetratricopeptide (TPR) repeat protein